MTDRQYRYFPLQWDKLQPQIAGFGLGFLAQIQNY